MAFATLQNRLQTSTTSGKVSVQSDVISGLLYCWISKGTYASVALAKADMIVMLGKEHAALGALNKIGV